MDDGCGKFTDEAMGNTFFTPPSEVRIVDKNVDATDKMNLRRLFTTALLEESAE